MLIGGATVAGLVLGAVLGFSGGLDLVDEPARVAATATATFYDCPEGEPLGSVARGDRVFITGRDQSGGWVQVRSPLAVNTRAWIRTAHVLPDDSTGALSVRSCHVPVEVIAVSATTTTATVEPTTTSSSTTTTSVAPPTTTTTLAPPAVSGVTANPAPIWEEYFPISVCPAQPDTATVSGIVSAPAGVQSVTMSWQVGGLSGSSPMAQSGGQYEANLGPFDAENPNVVPQGGSLPIAVTVTVIDALGRSASAQTTVTLNDCTFG
jgi:hypothetical protein